MTDDRIREAGRRLARAWVAARPPDAYPEELRARFARLGAIDIAFVD